MAVAVTVDNAAARNTIQLGKRGGRDTDLPFPGLYGRSPQGFPRGPDREAAWYACGVGGRCTRFAGKGLAKGVALGVAIGLAVACGDDGDPSGDTAAMTAASVGDATVAGDTSNATSDDPADSGGSDAPQDTGAPDSSGGPGGSGAPQDTGAPGSSGGSNDSGGPTGDAYGMCTDSSDCMAGIEEGCILVASMCAAPCMTDDQCPAAPSGDATPTCVQTSGVTRCLLDCDETTTCPPGMMCAAPTFASCIWP